MKKIFPIKLQLQIFQLDEYSPLKFLGWISNHFFTRTIENKKKLVWTQKARGIYYLAIFFTFLEILLLTILFKFAGFIIALLLATQSYIFILIAYFLLLPLEIKRKNEIKNQTKKKIESLEKKGLKVIGITGSYGKTSVKEFLYQILKTKYKVLKTPESYNTPQGIAKVVDLELDDSYEYFICEMGAYRVSEIKEICDMVLPTYGILTGINEQHLETFGSLENTTRGKFELIDSLPKDGFGIVNTDNERIRNEYQNHNAHNNLSNYGYYALSDKQFRIKNIHYNDEGTTFDIIFSKIELHAYTKLLGFSNIQNILAAATMAYKLKMNPNSIVEAIEHLEPVPHRLEIKRRENMVIIDDAYNSNVDGFLSAVELLMNFKKTKILVTPGIVDLGSETLRLHTYLGEQLHSIDYVFLIGNSDRTKGLKEGAKNKDIDKKIKIIEVDAIKDVWREIEKLNVENPVVLLENDLPDNY